MIPIFGGMFQHVHRHGSGVESGDVDKLMVFWVSRETWRLMYESLDTEFTRRSQLLGSLRPRDTDHQWLLSRSFSLV